MTDVTVDDAVDAYLQRKAVADPDGPGAGAYAVNAESILRRFADWLARDHDVDSIVALETAHLRSYARSLEERTDRGDFTASSARTYFAVVRAFLVVCRWRHHSGEPGGNGVGRVGVTLRRLGRRRRPR